MELVKLMISQEASNQLFLQYSSFLGIRENPSCWQAKSSWGEIKILH